MIDSDDMNIQLHSKCLRLLLQGSMDRFRLRERVSTGHGRSCAPRVAMTRTGTRHHLKREMLLRVHGSTPQIQG